MSTPFRKLHARYRFFRKVANRYRQIIAFLAYSRYRFLRRLRFRYLRLLVFFMWRLWVRSVEGFDNIPEREAAIIVSNHVSYYDFFVTASVLKKQTVFVAVKGLQHRPFVGWFMKLDTIIYIDREKPGYAFFKELMRHLQNRKLVVVYPEGTRSRSGKMLAPKPGFVKFAIKANAPVIPVAMKGTYEILPPQRHLPRFQKCNVIVGNKIYISPANPLLRDVFLRKKTSGRFKDLQDDELTEIAFRVMNEIRKMSGQEWDESALALAERFGVAEQFSSGQLSA